MENFIELMVQLLNFLMVKNNGIKMESSIGLMVQLLYMMKEWWLDGTGYTENFGSKYTGTRLP
jgi:hypothetical protein